MFMQVSVPKNEKLPNQGRLHAKKLLAVAFSVLLILFFSHSVFAQNIRVRGHVTNETGQPVPKPSVVIKGTSNGVTGNDNGDFEISAPGNATLIISSVGYGLQEVAVDNKTTVNVSLASASGSMNEVIVVGYGTQRKRDVTGAVTSINEATLKQVPAPNLISQLKGRTAGVDIVSNSATPGGGGSIRIRGNRTITNSQSGSDQLDQPLLVLDGIPFGGSINDLNPDDIANIEILKDASATAIYGSRG